ncbi:MAG: helix-hairpin-helix domain-containing protein [Agathobacter sp.]|nr:helix-hairpin-helix domain-containing protein [Agathobacter sp.]
MRHIAKTGIWIALCVLFAGCKGADDSGFFLLEPQSGETAAFPETERAAGADLPSDGEQGCLFVYVCGEVRHSGVYELPAGSRICDALEAAGGLTDAASPDYWNLARTLEDGEMIFFPTREEADRRREAAEAAGAAEASSVEGAAPDGRVNINTATEDQLMKLPGIGEVRAAAIIAYRSRHGAFSGEEDIMQVSGIGNALFENIRDFITVD